MMPIPWASSYLNETHSRCCFWFYLPHVTDKRKVQVSFRYNGTSNEHQWRDTDKRRESNGWWRVGPWDLNLPGPWEQTCRVEGSDCTVSFDVPPRDSILEVLSGNATPPLPASVSASEIDIAGDLNERLLEDHRLKDVVFVLKDGEEKAHKVILAAASDAFAAMFTGSMQEGRDGRVKLEGITRVEMRVFLRLLYTGRMLPEDWKEQHDSDAMPLKVLCTAAQLAKKYIVVNVQQLVIEVLKGRLADAAGEGAVKTFEEIASTAIQIDDGALRFACINAAKDSGAILEHYGKEGFRPEVQAELQALWAPSRPVKKSRRLA